MTIRQAVTEEALGLEPFHTRRNPGFSPTSSSEATMSDIEAMANAGAEGAKAGKASLDLIGKVFGPVLTRRQAAADAQAEIQVALANRLSHHIESNPLDADVLEMLATCGGRASVANLANILSKALPMLDEESDPSLVSDSWTANWRDKARLIPPHDEDVALLFAQLLASEANSPGSKSKKAVNVLADMEPEDAKLFRALSNFRLAEMRTVPITFAGAPPLPRSRFNTAPNPPFIVVLDPQNELYSSRGVDFQSLAHLESLGLVKVVPQGYQIGPGKIALAHSKGFLILTAEMPIPMGQAYLTTAGAQLTDLCVPLESPEGFPEYLTNFWQSQGIAVSEDLNEVMKVTLEAYHQDTETGEWINQNTNERYPADHFGDTIKAVQEQA